MRTRHRPLWTVDVEHEFFDGPCDALEFFVPAASSRILSGARAIVRAREGRLVVLIEVGDDDLPLANAAALVGRSVHFGLTPRNASFENVTVPHGLPRGQRLWWKNRVDADVLDGPHGLLLSGEQLRVEPASAQRPAGIRVLTPDGSVGAAFQLGPGEEGRTLTELWPVGESRIEETIGGAVSTRTCLVDGELARSACWGVLSLTIAAAHLGAGHAFTIAFTARSDRLRYYVVGQRFSATDLAEVEVRDRGFAAQGRPEITFRRVLPAEFGPDHLRPELLDANGGARIALFESNAVLERRSRAPTRIELLRNDAALVSHLPAPGADRPDAQFVVHLNKP